MGDILALDEKPDPRGPVETDLRTTLTAKRKLCRLAARLRGSSEKDALLFVLANIGLIKGRPADQFGRHLRFRLADFYAELRRAGRALERGRMRAAFYRLREPGFSPDPKRPKFEIGFFHTVEIKDGVVDLTVEDYVLDNMPILTDNFRDSIRLDAINVFMLGKAKSKGLYIDLKAEIRTLQLKIQDVFIPLTYLRQDLGLSPDSYRSLCKIGKAGPRERLRRKDFEELLTKAQEEISRKTDLKIVRFSLERCTDESYRGTVCYGLIGYRFEVAFQRNGTATAPRSKRTPKAPEQVEPRRWGNQYSLAADREKDEYEGPKDDAGRPLEDADDDDQEEEGQDTEEADGSGPSGDAEGERKKGDSENLPDDDLPF